MIDWIAFDFETSGTLPEYALQPWRFKQGLAWPTSLVWARKEHHEWSHSGGTKPTRETVKGLFKDATRPNRRVVGWNTVFDIQWLLAMGFEKEVFATKWMDAMLLWRHLTITPEYTKKGEERKPYGLKDFVKEVWPKEAGYEDSVDFHDTSSEASERLLKYNVKDVEFTLRAADLLWDQLTERQRTAAVIEAEALPLVAQSNLQGMLVDRIATRALRSKLEHQADECLTRLQPIGMTREIIGSPKQLADLMFKQWGVIPRKMTAKSVVGQPGQPSTDKEVLYELGLTDPRVKMVKEYRESLGQCTKFVVKPMQSVAYNLDDCTHPQARVFGTYTGRITYSSKQGKNKETRQIGFAIHQMKRGPEFRVVLIPPLGYTLVEFDAAGQEFRWMAVCSADTTMLDLCRPGEDPHSYLGAIIAKVDYRDLILRAAVKGSLGFQQRMIGKVGNLSLQYRTSAARLLVAARVDYEIPMTAAEAQSVWRGYRKAYPNVMEYWQRQIAIVQTNCYVTTLAGRRVQVVGDWSLNGWAMGSTAINYRIQGTGADQKYLALAFLKPLAQQHGARFAWDLHDGLYFYVPDANVDAFARAGKLALDNLPYQAAWGMTPPIAMPWDCKTGGSWGDLKEFKFK